MLRLIVITNIKKIVLNHYKVYILKIDHTNCPYIFLVWALGYKWCLFIIIKPQ